MHTEFYTIASQILPLLFIGLALQTSTTGSKTKYKSSETRNWIIHIDNFLMVISIMFYSEYIALRDVYYGKAGRYDVWTIALALLVPSIIIIYEYSFKLLGFEKQVWSKLENLFVLVFVVWIVLIIIGAFSTSIK